MKIIALVMLSAVVLLGSGCATPPAPANAGELALAPGQYALAFAAAEDELRDIGFLMDRVDAHEGVILTKPLEATGVAAPWDRSQSAMYQEFEDVMHRQRRQVRVTFEPAEPTPRKAAIIAGVGAGATGGPPPEDLRENAGATTMRVHAVILRAERAGWKPDATALTRSKYWWDDNLAARGVQPESVVPYREDTPMEERLVQRVLERMEK